MFCAGADLTGDAFAADYPDRLIALHKAIDSAPMPVIGAINGPAIGAGLQLAMICDLRVVAPDAFFQFPTSKYGLALDNWSIRRLSSLAGYGRARAMLLTAEKLTADVALQTGMANRHRHPGRRAGLGRRDRGPGAAGAAARQAGAQRRRRLRGPVAGAQGAVRQGVGQPGRHRGAGGARGEAAAEFPGSLRVLRAALRFGFGTATLLGGGWVLRALHGAPAALGAGPGEIHAVAQRSPNYQDGVVRQYRPGVVDQASTAKQQRLLIRELAGIHAAPAGRADPSRWPRRHRPTPHRPSLAVSWYGHSSALVEVDGYRVLTDPVWSRRCSPSRRVGPQRMHEVPVPLEALPAVDAVLVSHDHYDHLDIDTIVGLARTQRAPFVVPLGVGAHLRKWGIPEERIVELDWNESHRVGELTLVCTPARHFSGRLLTRNTTLWASWVIAGPRHRAFFGGDTGYTKSFAEIGADHGPVRPDADAGRGLPPGLAGHPHEPRGGGAGAPRRRRSRVRAAGADPLGDVPAGPASVVGTHRTACRRGRPRRRTRSRCPGPGSVSTRPASSTIDPWWQL